MEENLRQNERRRWMHGGSVLMLCALVLSTALFTTSLERRLLNVFLWSVIVSTLYAMSALSFLLAWRGRRDRLGVTALALALAATLVLAGFIAVAVGVSALNGLR